MVVNVIGAGKGEDKYELRTGEVREAQLERSKGFKNQHLEFYGSSRIIKREWEISGAKACGQSLIRCRISDIDLI